MTAGSFRYGRPLHRLFLLATALFLPLLALVLFANAATSPLRPLLVYSAFDGAKVGSLALGHGQKPVISHQRLSEGRFKLALTFCDNLNCVYPTTRFVADGGDHHLGWYSDLALNSSGYPVFSYSDDFPNYDLKLGVCSDAACAISPTLATIDGQSPAAEVGLYNSLALKSDDRPVIAYYDQTNSQLKLAVCQDAACALTPTLRVIDSASALPLSLALYDQDYPRIAYASQDGLELAVCDDASCAISPTIQLLPDTATDISLALNSLGNPVIAYISGNNLRLFICEDATCASRSQVNLGGASGGASGSRHVWLALDEDDRPVISFRDATFGILKLAVCVDRLCGRSTTHFVDGMNSGAWSALALTDNGVPVIAHQISVEADVALSVCRICVLPTINLVDGSEASVRPAMALNSQDHPVIGYRTQSGDLKLAVCQDAACALTPTLRVIDPGPTTGVVSLVVDNEDRPVVGYYDSGALTANLAICDDVTCTSYLTTTIGSGLPTGDQQNLALNSSDFAVLTYGGITYTLELAVCNDAICSSPTLTTVDANGASGHLAALALNSDDYPVIAYRDETSLKLALCSDATCTTLVTRTLDAEVAYSTPDISLALDEDGAPVVSYLGSVSTPGLKLAVCSDALCSSFTIKRPSYLQFFVNQNYGWSTSLALSGGRLPVISFHDKAADRVWLAVCTSPTCSRLDQGGMERVAFGQIEVDNLFGSPTIWDGYTSLALDRHGTPVIAYWGRYQMRLEVATFKLPQAGPSAVYLPVVLRP